MSAGYQAVGWNRQKRRYDALALGGVALFLATFVGLSAALRPNLTAETLLIRGLGAGALLLLHVILCIGPLCRLDRRFLPLLYNRRHLGVLMFSLALGHGAFALVQYHGFGDLNPLVSLLVSNSRWDSLPAFPFQQLGAAALLILFLMAATSHDFWLSALSAPVWKALHMGVYLAYGLVTLHVALGALQAETTGAVHALFGMGLAVVLALHALAARREAVADVEPARSPGADGFVDVLAVAEIPEGRARTVCLSGDRVAVFRHGDKVSAVSNACKHQNGPLGEGRIIDGCITCPWHGYQYHPETGASPPPFTETVPTFHVRVLDGRVWVHPTPNPPGTRVAPAQVEGPALGAMDGAFYVGYLDRAPAELAAFVRARLTRLAALVVAVAAVLALGQDPGPPSRFAFGQPDTYEGTVALWPHPVLLVDAPGTADGARSAWLMVAPFKHGADADFASLDGHRVRLTATAAWLDARTLLEVDPASVVDLGPGPAAVAPLDLGTVTLQGEIVDSKCWLGVMNPGATKPHRDCAVRCLSGGIPPSLVVRTPSGDDRVILLVGSEGEAIGREVLDLVAEPVEVTGRLERRADLDVLFARVSDIQRR